MVSRIYKEGIKYKKCGVVLTCLEPKSGHTYDLLTDFKHIEKKECLMKAMDGIHSKFGKKKLGIGPYYVPIATGQCLVTSLVEIRLDGIS